MVYRDTDDMIARSSDSQQEAYRLAGERGCPSRGTGRATDKHYILELERPLLCQRLQVSEAV